jgi:hypothetical protein
VINSIVAGRAYIFFPRCRVYVNTQNTCPMRDPLKLV